MKARCWYQAEIPVPNVPPSRRETFDNRVAQLVRAADAAAGLTRSAVKRALFARPAEARGDFSFLTDRFWRDTEARFFDLLNDLAEEDADDAILRERWLLELRRTALAIFDDAAPSEGLEAGAWRRLVDARKWLAWNLRGKEICAKLGLPPPLDGAKKAAQKTKEKVP